MKRIRAALRRHFSRRQSERAIARAVVIESLEIRRLLSYTVTSLADNGSSGTLRYEIQQADAASGNQTVTFASSILIANGSVTIDLTSGSLELDKSSGTLTIQGPGASLLTLDGSIINDAYSTVVLSGVTVQNPSGSGGVSNDGNLTIVNSIISGGTGVVNGTRYYYHYGSRGGYGSGQGYTSYLHHRGHGSGGGYTSGSGYTSGGGYTSGSNQTYGPPSLHSNASLTITDSTITGSSIYWQNGAGVANIGGYVDIDGSTISDNSITYSGSAGGIFNRDGMMTITDSVITGNTASGAFGYYSGGGGILNTGSLIVSDSTISGNSGGGITNEGKYGNASIDNSTIDDNSGDYGAIHDIGPALTISNSTISGNRDAGISAFNNYYGVGGTLNILDCTISDNRYRGVVSEGTVTTITGSTISGNTSQNWNRGGGIVIYGSSATLTDCTVDDNSAKYGGGVMVESGSATISDCTLDDNTATLDGGAIENLGTLSVSNSWLYGNSASDGAGTFSDGATTITSSTISDNYASTNGAGIFAEGSITVSNTTISGNTASSKGGGIYGWLFGTDSLSDCTLARNYAASSGGGIYRQRSSTFILSGTIVAENTGGDLAGGTFSGTYNLIGDGSGGLSGSPNFTGNPDLSALGFYGGPTPTMALLPVPGNPAIGYGSSFETTDQRGLGRPGLSNQCDIGAFQTQTNSLEVNTSEDGSIGSGMFSLRDAINLANVEGENQTITFTPSMTASGPVVINLDGEALNLDDTSGLLTIEGPTPNPLTISAQSESSVFNIASGSSALLENLIITGGGHTGYSGGGVVNDNGSLTIVESTISGNENYSGYGGGISSYGGYVKISYSTISGNIADEGGGGLSQSNGPVQIAFSTISGNIAERGGGGIYQNHGQLNVYDSTITENNANTGAGIFIRYDTNGSYPAVTITDSTITGNVANPDEGGGIYTQHTYNTSIEGTIVAGNTGGDLSGFGTFQGIYNLIGDGTGGLSDQPSSHNIQGTISSPIDPDLTPLGYFGGPTKTMALMPGSPAIGNGSNSSVGNEPLGNDQRGLPRSGSNIDIGAFQTQLSLLVNTTQDATATDPGVLSLRDALNIADAVGGDQTITFSINGTIDLDGNDLSLNDANYTITINGPGSSNLSINAQGESRIFDIESGTTVNLNNLYITGGHDTTGAGIANYGTLTITDSVVNGNTATGIGGGIANFGILAVDGDSVVESNDAGDGGGIWSNGSLTVKNSTITGNSAGSGAGIWNSGTLYVTNSTLTNNHAIYGGGLFNCSYDAIITNSSISDNSATWAGGGIFELEALTITDSSISGNSSDGSGGGIFSNNATLTVNSSILSGNSSSQGGGIDNFSDSTLSLADSTITGNNSSSGGGISNYSSATISDSTISDNSASTGGGISNYGPLTISDSTISGNSAMNGFGGGGIYNYGLLTVVNCTITGNSASTDNGGGIKNFGPAYIVDSTIYANMSDGLETFGEGSGLGETTLEGTIVAGNSQADIAGDHNRNTGTYDLIGDGSGELSTESSAHNILGSTSSPIDPLLAPLGNYGGLTQTMPPLSESPALGTGAEFSFSDSPITTDQRGFTRAEDTTSDIGAVQVAPDGPYIAGPESIQTGQTYTLDLYAGSISFDHWAINWGDGTDSDPDITTVSNTAPPFANHTFTVAPANDVITGQLMSSSDQVLATTSLALDSSYNATGRDKTTDGSKATALAIQSNGDIVAITDISGEVELERFNTSGQLDTTFGSNGSGYVQLPLNVIWSTLAIGSNDEIAVGGAGQDELSMVTYGADGTSPQQDSTNPFDSDGSGTAQAIAIADVNGKVAIVGGDFDSSQGTYSAVAAEFTSGANKNWQIQEASNGQYYAYTQVAIDPSSGYVYATKADGHAVDQIDSSGNLTQALIQPSLSDSAVTIEANGNLLLGGQDLEQFFSGGASDTYFGTSGSVSTYFSTATPDEVIELIPQPNGQTLVLGQDLAGDYLLARYNYDGNLDGTFGNAGIVTNVLADSSTLQDPQVIQLANGEYEIASLDPDGNIDIAQLYGQNTVAVAGPPNVSLNPIPAATENSPLTITVAVTSGGALTDTLTYQWIVTDNGNSFALPNNGITGGPSLTFTPDSVGTGWAVSLTVTDTTLSPSRTTTAPASPAAFSVNEAPTQIVGPVSTNEGTAVTFTTTAESGSDVEWTATNGDESIPSSGTASGSNFNFTPDAAGTWIVTANVNSPGDQPQTITADLTSIYVPPTVSILGSPIGFAGHAMTFSSNVVQTPGVDDAISYAWSLNGPGTLPTLVGADTANITVPGLPAPSGTDTSETYQLTLTITDDHDTATSEVTQTMEFLVLADPPSDGQFTLGAIPTMLFDDENATEAKSDFDFASAAAVLPNGDIVVTGWIGGSDAWDNYGQDSNDMNGDFGTFAYMPFLAMFNPDLTLDTNFGPDHTGIEPIANTISPDALDDNNGLLISSQGEGFNDDETDSGFTPIPVAMTINPLNDDIVVVGYQGGNELDDFGESDATSTAIPFVAEFLSTPKLVDGEMVPAGSMDPNFNQGYLLYVNLNDDPNVPIPAGQTWYGRVGSVVALDDGSILVGGEQSLIDNNGPDYSQDFLLFKLTSSGQLDSQFGELISDSTTVRDGVAAHTWVMSNLYEANIYSDIYATVKSIALQPGSVGDDDIDDDIIVAGYAGNPTTGVIDNWGDEYQGYYIGFPETDFVLQRYNSDGTLDKDPLTGFGPDHSGQVTTAATAFDSSDDSNTDAWLGGMTVITSGDSSGDIVAAGMIASAASGGLDSDDYYGFNGSYTIGIAEYSPDGLLMSANLSALPTLTGLRGPGAYGTFQQDYSVGGDIYGDNVGEYTFNPSDGSVYVSINNYWEGSESSVQLAHMNIDGTADTSFGPGGVATYTLPDTSWQITVPGALLWTDSGIYVTGQLTTAGASGGPQAQVDADPMVLRYNGDSDSEITLTAAATPNNSISLTWTSPGTADAYQIEQKQNGSAFVPIATVGGGARSYVDSSVSADESYQYEIIPLNSNTSGALNPGSPSNTVSVTSFSNSGATLVDTLSVPVLLTGDETPPTSIDLYNGDQYLVVVSGTTAIAPDYDGLTNTEDYITDGAYWYAENTPSINGNTLDFNPTTQLPIPFGLGISGDQESPTTIAVPNWGAFDLGNHTYDYVVTGNGGALTLAFQSADAIDPDYPTGTLQVQIYQLSSGTSSFSTAVRAITSPLATDGLPPTISGPTAINVVSTAANGGSAPWQLWLVSSSGQDVKLASGDGPTGSFPMSGAAVVTIDPTRFTNGLYTLELTDGSGDLSNPSDAELISIQGIVKLGDLNQSDTDTTILSGGTSLPVTGVYDSDQSNVAGPLGNGWSLNLLDSQLTTTEAPEAYDPQQFASEVMRDGALIVFGGPTAGYNFEFEPEQNDDGTFTANFINVGAGPGDPGYGDTIKLVAAATSMSVEETEDPISLTRDPVLNEYMYTYFDSSVGHDVQVAFNPANPDCHLVFVLTAEWNSEQYAYFIDPATGEVENYTANTAVWLAFSSEYNTLGSQLNSGLVYYPTVFDMLGDSLGTGQLYDNSTMSPGALISLTVPNGGNDIFEFDPTLIDQDLTGGISSTSVDYQPNFISLTGSSDVLTVIADPSTQEGGNGWQDEVSDPVTGEGYDISGAHEYAGMSQSNIDLVYDATDNEFLILNRIAKFAGFDPSDPLLGLAYQLTTSSGYVYIINATTGRIESCTTTNGAVVYSVNPITGNIVDGNGNTLLNIQWSGNPLTSQIMSIQAPGQNSVTYEYDSNGDLTSVIDESGNKTTYSYEGITHLLTGITNSLGVNVLSAQYAPIDGQQTDGELLSVTDRNGVNFAIDYTLANGEAGVRTVTDAAGDVSEDVYDQYGNVIRAIEPVETTSDTDGVSLTSLTGYTVMVNDFTYALDQAGNPSPGIGTLTVLQSIEFFTPIQISGTDPDFLRYFEEPLTSTMTAETTYVTDGEFIGQLESSTQPIDFSAPASGSGTVVSGINDGALQETINSNFAVVNVAQNVIKPLTVVTEVMVPDSNAPSGFDQTVQSVVCYQYDPQQGDLILSVTAVDPSDSGSSTTLLAEGTAYDYSNGFQVDSYKVTATIALQTAPNQGIVSGTGIISNFAPVSGDLGNSGYLTKNTYYQSTNPAIGAIDNQVEYSTNSSGQITFYAYNSAGQTVLDYTYKTIINPAGIVVGIWVGTTSIYNDEDELTDTYQATYLDDDENGTPTLNTVGSGDDSVSVDTTKNPMYSGTSLLRTAHYDYNDVGQMIDSIDQYGGMTSYIYDSNGQTIETEYPNGTVVMTVYDDQGRTVWTTQPFVPGSGSAVATNTIYNVLGQVVETDEYLGTVINVVSGSSSTESSQGTLISSTLQVYNSKGQVVETDEHANDSADELRTGTVYFPDGQVAYTGILLAGASADWYDDLAAEADPQDYLQNYFASYTANEYDQYDSSLNLFYNQVTDQNGNTTKTYQDGEGRTVRTVYADGSYTETLYGYGNSVVASDEEGDAIAPPTNWSGVPGSGSEVVTINQSVSDGTSPLVVTYDIYDQANRLIDVYEPAVLDSNPNSPTYGQMVNPEWSYVYDIAGNEIVQVSPDEQAAFQPWLSNNSGVSNSNVTGTYMPAVGATYTPFAGGTNFEYDQNGNQVLQILPDGESESWHYDQYNRLAKSVDFDGNVTTYTYYNSGPHAGMVQQVVYKAPAGSDNPSETVSYEYDSFGNQTNVNDASGSTTNGYDAFNNLTESNTPEGDIYYVYDPTTGLETGTWTADTASQPGSYTVTLPAGSKQGTVVLNWDDSLNAYTQTPGTLTGWSLTQQLDGNQDWTLEHSPDGSSIDYKLDDIPQTTAGGPDASKLSLATLTDPNGWGESGLVFEAMETYTTYGYDNQGRLTTVSMLVVNGLGLSTPLVTSYTYDAAGNKTSETLPDGEVTTYTYDSENRLISQVEMQGSTLLFSQQYTLNSDGTRATSFEIQLQSGGGDQITFTDWTYDAEDRLTGEYVTGLPTSITLPAADTNGSSDVPLAWDGTGAFVSSSGTASQIIAGTEAGMALLSPVEGQSISGNANDWILCQSDGTPGDQVWTAFTFDNGTFTPVTALVSINGNIIIVLPMIIALPEAYNSFAGMPGAPAPVNGQLLLRWNGEAYVSGNTLGGIVGGQEAGLALIPPSVVNSLTYPNSAVINSNGNWLLFDSAGSGQGYYPMYFSLDQNGNFTPVSQVFAETSDNLPETIEIPAAYNLFSSVPYAAVASNGMITLNWNYNTGTYATSNGTNNILNGNSPGVVLISPTAAQDGYPYVGNGTDWVIYATDGGQNGNPANWVEITLALSDAAFSPDGFYTASSGPTTTFPSTPSFTVGFSSTPPFSEPLQTGAAAFTIASSSSLDYSDTYTYDLDNNRMSDVHIGPAGGPDQTTTYVYNGDDELLSQLTIDAGSTGFSYTDSTYDANGSMTAQYADSPASNDSFGSYSEIDAPPTFTTNTGDSASASSTGIGGTVITSIDNNLIASNASILLPNGDILSVGYAYDDSGHQDIALVAYDPTTGLPDTSFGTDGYVLTNINNRAAANAVTLVDNQYILVAGYGNNSNYTQSFLLAEYTLDGALNTSFGDGQGYVTTNVGSGDVFNAVTIITSAGEAVDIVAAGSTASSATGGYKGFALAEYDLSGNLITSFGGNSTGFALLGEGMQPAVGFSAQANAVAVLSSGDIVVAGYGTGGYDAFDHVGIVLEYSSSGILVPTFGSLGMIKNASPNGSTEWNAMAITSGGDILVAGYEGASDGHNDIAVAEYSSDSHLVKSFGTDGTALLEVGSSAVANAMVITTDGKILLTGSGTFSYLNGDNQIQSAPALVLAQLTSTGQADGSFGVNGVATILADSDVAYTGYGLLLTSATSVAVTGTVDGLKIFVSEYELSPEVTTYGYDVRNKLVSYSDGTNTATYVYDDSGDRVAETVNGVTSFYLTDEANPTGYDQPIEVWTSSDDHRADAALQTTYILGDRILAQVDSSGNISYLLTDGHGSTQQMTDSSGNVTATFSYDAFGTALNFDAATAGTQILFGGDAIYDPVSGLYMHGDGIRDTLGFLFIQMDPTNGSNTDPISLHKYLYADANPINETDPSGNDGIWDYVDQVVDAVEDQSTATAALATAIGNGASNGLINALTNLATTIGAAIIDAITGMAASDNASDQLSHLQSMGNTFAQQDKNWNYYYFPWGTSNECADQAANLESYLLTSQYWIGQNPPYWTMSVIEGSTWKGFLHHNVVLLTPAHGNSLQPMILDAYHGPFHSKRQCICEPLSVWQQTYRYPE